VGEIKISLEENSVTTMFSLSKGFLGDGGSAPRRAATATKSEIFLKR
jgi:hypothetical protein